jgi:hypothetical protein
MQKPNLNRLWQIFMIFYAKICLQESKFNSGKVTPALSILKAKGNVD